MAVRQDLDDGGRVLEAQGLGLRDVHRVQRVQDDARRRLAVARQEQAVHVAVALVPGEVHQDVPREPLAVEDARQLVRRQVGALLHLLGDRGQLGLEVAHEQGQRGERLLAERERPGQAHDVAPEPLEADAQRVGARPRLVDAGAALGEVALAAGHAQVDVLQGAELELGQADAEVALDQLHAPHDAPAHLQGGRVLVGALVVEPHRGGRAGRERQQHEGPRELAHVDAVEDDQHQGLQTRHRGRLQALPDQALGPLDPLRREGVLLVRALAAGLLVRQRDAGDGEAEGLVQRAVDPPLPGPRPVQERVRGQGVDHVEEVVHQAGRRRGGQHVGASTQGQLLFGKGQVRREVST
ncbi:hypothetical protein VTK73DRAFT_5637 [Phialemonium thermophilum]|uniref:Uncharacterized protein n=1 Tax=Phialemonium thermophilum TaxID=223376 RepID=A0ABR3V1G9_9PEZI